LLALIRLLFCSRPALLAENLFLRRQFALFQGRKTKPRRITATVQLTLLALAQFFDQQSALVAVKPATFIKWRRTAFRMF